MRRIVLSLLAVTLLWSVGGTYALAADTGTIQGTVKNGTPGGGSVAGLTVTLRRFNGADLVQQYTATVDEQGHFTFSGLPVVDGEAYIAVVNYKGVQYVSSMLQLTQNPSQTADITVYETSRDASTVRIDSRSLVIAGAVPEQRLLEIMDIIIVTNTGDHTYIGDDTGTVLRIPLPEGAQEISPQADPAVDFGQPRLDNGTLVTTGPVPPGTHNLVLSYAVPYNGTQATLAVGTAMPTGTLRVLVRNGTYDLSSRSLFDNGTVNVSGVDYHVLAVDAPIVGDRLVITVSKLPRAGGGGLSQTVTLAIVGAIGGAGFVVALILLLLVLQRRRTQLHTAPAGSQATEAEPREVSPDDERLELAAALNRLDMQRDAGEIDESTYVRERAALQERLRALLLRERGLDELVSH